MLRALTSFTGLSLVLLTACHKGGREAELKELRDAEQAEEKAWTSKDLDKALSFYADDAVVMNSGMPALTKKDQIRDYIQRSFADPAFARDVKVDATDLSESGDLGYTGGTYESIFTDPGTKLVVMDEGNWLTVHKKDADGKWKIARVISSSDLPPLPPAPKSATPAPSASTSTPTSTKTP